MIKSQLAKIVKFVKPIYKKTGKFHAWDHILAVRKNALFLAMEFPKTNLLLLEAACYIHDIGRSIKDEGHNEKSAEIATPFLKKIGLDQNEIKLINHAVVSHEKGKISSAKTVEAKILFDADKLEILSVYGFIRIICWLSEERKMPFSAAINFLWKWIIDVRKNYIQTKQAKKIIDQEMPAIRLTVTKFNNWGKFKVK